MPLPLARRSVQTAPVGQASPAQVYVHRPPGMAAAQIEPTEHAASVVHASPMLRTEAALHVPVSHTRPVPHCESAEHRVVTGSLEHAQRATAEPTAAKVRIRTVPPSGPVRAVSQDTPAG